MKLIKKKNKTRWNSCVELNISGYNVERTLNFLCEKGVEFKEIEKFTVKEARIQIKSKDLNYVKKYLNERKIEIINEKYLGVEKIKKTFVVRWGLGVGAFIAIAFIIVMSNFVLKVEVFGAESVSSSEIIKTLEQNGIASMTHLNSVSTEEVEKLIMANFDDVSMVSAIKKGSTIIINIKEKLKNEEYEGLNNLSPLLATQNGMISDIQLIQGTLLVKVGDIVKVGDPLVAPYTLDSSGKEIPIIPKAKIVADVWITATSEHCESYMKNERTGEVVSFRKTEIMGVPLFSNEKEIYFDNYEVEEKVSYLSDYFIPIKYTETFYFETKCVIIEEKFEDVKEKIIQEAKDNAVNQISKNAIIKKEEFSIAQNGSRWIVTYTITTSQDIAN